jgi:hypothetical protein
MQIIVVGNFPRGNSGIATTVLLDVEQTMTSVCRTIGDDEWNFSLLPMSASGCGNKKAAWFAGGLVQSGGWITSRYP